MKKSIWLLLLPLLLMAITISEADATKTFIVPGLEMISMKLKFL